ncbi:Zinc finger MYND domain-containing protein 10 [Geranomyces michiganensis]|nr:Zinc finger MYND domain-containing protein 10 [Geranomyces michiganensis]
MANNLSEETPLLTVFEAEHLIDSLRQFTLAEVGSPRWMKQHENMERLNIQAHWNTAQMREEFVAVQLVDREKMETVVYDLLLIDTWKKRVWPQIDAQKINSENVLRVYFMLYHETTVLNLLEIVLYNEPSVTALGDSVVDLIDYCARKLVALVTWPTETDSGASTTTTTSTTAGTPTALLSNPAQTLRTHLSALSLLRHVVSNLSALPFAVMTRLLVKHDVVVGLAGVLERKPWERRVRGDGKRWVWERFTEAAEWKVVDEDERAGVVSWAAQAWLTLYTLMLDPECRKQYEFTTRNHATLLKLRSHLTPSLLDQIPPLGDLLRHLEQLSLYEPPTVPSSRPLAGFVEELPVLETRILDGVGDLDALAKLLARQLASAEKDAADITKGLAETYTHPTLTTLLPTPAPCANPACPNRETHPVAAHRCSACRSEWYCGRACQVACWKSHKRACEMMRAAAEADASAHAAGNTTLKNEPLAMAAEGRIQEL